MARVKVFGILLVTSRQVEGERKDTISPPAAGLPT